MFSIIVGLIMVEVMEVGSWEWVWRGGEEDLDGYLGMIVWSMVVRFCVGCF